MTPRTTFQPFISDHSRFDNCRHLHPPNLPKPHRHHFAPSRSSSAVSGCGGVGGDALADLSTAATSTTTSTTHGVRRVILCTGKVYYHLMHARRARKVDDVVLGRVEELAPFPHHLVADWVRQFPGAEVCWLQEEPKNLGFWQFVQPRIQTALSTYDVGGGGGGGGGSSINGDDDEHRRDLSLTSSPRVRYIGRPAAQSPATGSVVKHLHEMKVLTDAAFA